MSAIDAIILHAAHTAGGLPGWLVLLPPLPVVVVGLVRLCGWLWPRIRGGFDSRGEPL